MQTIEDKAMELEARLTRHRIEDTEIVELEQRWENDPRWNGVERSYRASEVLNLRGTLNVEYTLANAGAIRLWKLLTTEKYLPAIGALNGNQAVQQVEAGLKAIYLSGWQVAADNNLAGDMYSDQALYPSNSVPAVVRQINRALRKADQIQVLDCRRRGPYWFAPIVADGEDGFGGPLHAFEIMKEMIEAGAAGVHFEDQLSSAKKCGHMGGTVLVPIREFITKLIAARLAADVCGVPTLLIARTDAEEARFVTSDIDERDRPYVLADEPRTPEGYHRYSGGIQAAIERGLAFAPYADMIWLETSQPDLDQAKAFAEGIRKQYPNKMLSYNCSPLFNWKTSFDSSTIQNFQNELIAMGYVFQPVTLAGFHTMNLGMFDLAHSYKNEGLDAFSRFQDEEFKHRKSEGYLATSYQKFVGTGYFDRVMYCLTRE